MFFVHCACSAQKLNYGIEAGYVHNRLAVDEYTSTPRSGFLVGGVIDLTLKNDITFESGVSYIRRGGKVSGKQILGTGINSVKFNQMDYIRIPVLIGCNFHAHGVTLRPGVGGYFAVGVHGNSMISGFDPFMQPFGAGVSTFSGSSSMGIGTTYRPCDRVDAGMVFSLSAKYRHIGLRLNYDLGMMSTSIYGSGKHRSVLISVAYWFK